MSESQQTQDEAQTTNIEVREMNHPAVKLGEEGETEISGYIQSITEDRNGYSMTSNYSMSESEIETRFVADITPETIEQNIEASYLADPQELVSHDGEIEIKISVRPSNAEVFDEFASRVDDDDAVRSLETILKKTDDRSVARKAYNLGFDVVKKMLEQESSLDVSNLYKVPEENWDDKIVQVHILRK